MESRDKNIHVDHINMNTLSPFASSHSVDVYLTPITLTNGESSTAKDVEIG